VQKAQNLQGSHIVGKTIIAYLAIFNTLYYLGQISGAWFIACMVLGVIAGVLGLLYLIGISIEDNEHTARRITVYLVLMLAVGSSLAGAHDQLLEKKLRSSIATSTNHVEHSTVTASPDQFSQSTIPLSDAGSIKAALRGKLSALSWGSIRTIDVETHGTQQFLILVKWDVADTLAVKFWEFEYINLIISWAKQVFTNQKFKNVTGLRSEMYAREADIYGNTQSKVVISSTLYRYRTDEVQDWHQFKVQASLNPTVFFQTVAEDVYNVIPSAVRGSGL